MAFPTFRYYYTNPDVVIAGGLSEDALVDTGQGGTGHQSYNVGDLLVADTPASLKRRRLDDGQVLVGVSGGEPIAATLTAGEGISVANASGSITISADPQLLVTKATDSAQVTTTSDVFSLLPGVNVTPGAGDYLVFFDGVESHDDNGSGTEISLFVDGVMFPSSTRFWTGEKNEWYHIGTNSYVTGVLDGQAMEIRWRSLVDTKLSKMAQRGLIAVRLTT